VVDESPLRQVEALDDKVILVRPVQGPRLAPDWVKRLDQRLKTAHGDANTDFGWDTARHSSTDVLLVWFIKKTGKVTITEFVQMIRDAAEAIILPEIHAHEDMSGDKRSFIVLYKEVVGDLAWPEALTSRYRIVHLSDERTVHFNIINRLFNDAEESEMKQATSVLQRAIIA
jgi:hypothetical protein